MTEINHHLTDALIASYSAGILPEAMDLIVAAHISLCDECRASLEAQDAVGGAVLERAAPEAVCDASLAGTLAMIRGRASPAAPRQAPRRDPVLPSPLLEYVGGSVDDIRWRPSGWASSKRSCARRVTRRRACCASPPARRCRTTATAGSS